MKIGAHLEIHSADKHRFAILSVKVLAHPGAGTTTAGRSVGTASLPDMKIGAHLEIHSADKHCFSILSVMVLAHREPEQPLLAGLLAPLPPRCENRRAPGNSFR